MNANEIIARYFVTWLCGWLAKHGLPGFDDQSMVGAVAADVLDYGVPGLIVARAIYTSTVDWTLARLKARHKPALIAAANEVRP